MDDKYRTQDGSDIDNPAVGHEQRDVNVRIVVGFAVSLVIAAIIIHLFIWVLFDFLGHLETSTYPGGAPPGQPTEIRLPPSPRLQDKPREDLKALHKQEDALLNSYTWINQQAGAVRIPIWQAMDQVVRQGFPVTDQPVEGEGGLPQPSNSGRPAEPSIKR
jgi:hypothetical protein